MTQIEKGEKRNTEKGSCAGNTRFCRHTANSISTPSPKHKIIVKVEAKHTTQIEKGGKEKHREKLCWEHTVM